MLHTTRAVVLRTFKHTDQRTILKACTELFGTRSYVVRSGPKASSRSAALQPLARVELVVTASNEQELQSVRDIRVERPYLNVGTEPIRGVLLLFAQEVLYRTLREEAGDPALFTRLHLALEELDTCADLSGHPLRLLVMLMDHLGIKPEPPEPGEERFDMREGHFFSGDAPHEHCMAPGTAAGFGDLLREGWHGAPIASAPVRRALLDELLIYFRLHVDGFGELRSPEVLKQVLH
jgi:DNA repair protein RecO (recombination protein O)